MRKKMHNSNLGEQPSLHHDHSHASARQDGQNVRTERESKEKNTHKLIIEVAGSLFRQIGFHKTTIADIARELRMSPANVYRFFETKSDINKAVCMDLLGKIEAEAEKIATSCGAATQRIRNLISAIEKAHHKHYTFDRKLHDLKNAAISENWAIMRQHNHRIIAILEQVITSGMASGEFPMGDAKLAARLVNAACIRFSHPRLIVEFEQEPEPTLDQMIGFCLTVPTRQPV
jgi:AcrR family transcriptional regulator